MFSRTFVCKYINGFWLIFCRARPQAEAAQPLADDIPVRRWQSLYLLLLLVCLGVVILMFFVFIPHGAQALDSQMDLEAVRHQRIVDISMVFLCLLPATLLAQFLMYAFFMRPADEAWRPSAFWALLRTGMTGVFVTVVTLVVILAFKDIVTVFLGKHKDTVSLEVFSTLIRSEWGRVALTVPALGIIWWIGRMLGSAWGTFALGLILLDIVGIFKSQTDDPSGIGRTIVEALILLATWVNQTSPGADNVQAMLGPAHSTPETVRAVWSVPTIPRYPAWQAKRVQCGILAVSIAIALLCRVWLHVL